LREAIRVFATNTVASAHAWNSLGLAYHQAGQYENAALCYKAALDKNPNLFAARYNRGYLQFEQGGHTAAISELTSYTSHQPQDPAGWLLLGKAQLRAGVLDPAQTNLQQVLRLKATPRQQAEALNALGVAQARRRKAREAFQYFDASLNRVADYAPTLLNQAVLSQQLNDRGFALQKYQAYLEVAGNSPVATTVRAITNDLGRALALASQPAVPPPPPAGATSPPPATAVLASDPRTSPPPAVTATSPLPVVVATSFPPIVVRTSLPSPAVTATAVPPANVVTTPAPALAVTSPPPVTVTSTPPLVVALTEPAQELKPVAPAEPTPAPPTEPEPTRPPSTAPAEATREPTVAVPSPGREAEAEPPVGLVETPPEPEPVLERVEIPGETDLLPARDLEPPTMEAPTNAPTAAPPVLAEAAATAPATPESALEPDEPRKRSFFSRLNPVSWFGSKDEEREAEKAREREVEAAEKAARAAQKEAEKAAKSRGRVTEVDRPLPTASAAATSPPPVPTFARYTYQSPRLAPAGNREEADRLVKAGVEAHRAGRLGDAQATYARAVQADPTSFSAHYNLAVVAFDLEDWPRALASYERALVVAPQDPRARYGFGLALERAGYPLDAAAEWQKVLAQRSEHVEAHLALANLYATTLADPVKASEHYQRVLQLQPNHPQAPMIRRWLGPLAR
jgi:tetratricopeptide (TPR) repeat protein